MDPHRAAIVYIGDLGDPWVAAIAQALPSSQGIDLVDCAGDLPDILLEPGQPPRLIVVHRNRLTAADLRRLRDWRQPASSHADSATSCGPPAVFLCISPYVRYDELSRCSGLVDLVVSESEAADVLPRRVARFLGTEESRAVGNDVASLRIELAGGNAELCDALAEACSAAGYNARRAGDLPQVEPPFPGENRESVTQRVLTIWEVPVLEPDWSQRLEQKALTAGPVIALIGFADRQTVSQAKAAGAAACLDLPARIDDLLDVIDRVVSGCTL